MRAHYRLKGIESVWSAEQNQDLYIAVARKLRRDDERTMEDPDDEEANTLFEAKRLAYKDAQKRTPGQPVERAGQQSDASVPKGGGFGKR